MNNVATREIESLQAICNRPVVVYCVSDHPSKPLEVNDVPILYECLRTLGTTEQLDFVFYCTGGYVNAARRIALLLHNYTNHLRVLVPYKALSAGTLLCLGAHELVLGSMAEFTPIDPHIGSAMGQNPAGSPSLISAEDIRAYREMAENWFGLTSEEHRMQLFTLLNQRIFPTSLSSFYRADKEVRQIAADLLKYQLPGVAAGDRERIVNQLVSGYPSHDYRITREEAREIGLRVQLPSLEMESLVWNIYKACQQYMKTAMEGSQLPGTGIGGVIISANFAAQHVIRPIPFQPEGQPGVSTIEGTWEIL